jgi:hypothetical protein
MGSDRAESVVLRSLSHGASDPLRSCTLVSPCVYRISHRDLVARVRDAMTMRGGMREWDEHRGLNGMGGSFEVDTRPHTK